MAWLRSSLVAFFSALLNLVGDDRTDSDDRTLGVHTATNFECGKSTVAVQIAPGDSRVPGVVASA